MYKLVSMPVVIGLSIVSYKFVETPFRNKEKYDRNYIYTGSACVLVVMLSLGLLAHKKNGFLKEINEYYASKGIVSLVDAKDERTKINLIKERFYETTDIVNGKYGQSTNDHLCQDDSECRKILIIGDSFAEDIFLSLIHAEKNDELMLLRFDDECMDELGDVSNDDILLCEKYTKEELFEKSQWASHIIISSNWQKHTYVDGFNFATFISENTTAEVHVVGSIAFSNMRSIHLKLKTSIGDDYSKISNMFYRYARWDRIATSNEQRAQIIG